ncbi:MAG: rhomboid family intramembrane serine protease [Anaerolineae bacterium]|nr:rhomboid family intramembrane serine protease [Anaerolineae bacterium]
MDPQAIIVLIAFLQSLFFLPIQDRRERERDFPWMTLTVVIINVLIHGGLLLVFYMQDQALPDDLTWLIALYPYMDVPSLKFSHEGLGALSSLTSFFLHADLFHLLGNMFILWFFGRKVEDATGPVRFLLFYLLCGFASSFVSVLASYPLTPLHMRMPSLGASGAISGLMGAYLFLYSDQRIRTLIVARPFGCCVVAIPFLVWIPAWAYLIYSFVQDALIAQLIAELAKRDIPFSTGVGVFAHLGGALTGLACVYFFVHPEVLARRR